MSSINSNPWMRAIEGQLDALRLVRLFLSHAPPSIRDLKSWRVDETLLATASPFSWSDEVIQAVRKAGESIPLDTPLNKWNLNTEAVWWQFEKALPFQTVTNEDLHVRALCFGWIPTVIRDFGMPVCVWTDRGPLATEGGWSGSVTPSQTFEWERDQTLGEMLTQTRAHHESRYGPGGRDHNAGTIGVEKFMEATEMTARFVLAGLAWLEQKVLVTEQPRVERHRRKDYQRQVGREALIRVVQLRRQQRAPTEENMKEPLAGTVAWHCRWVVDGHWRNQACGPKHGDRKLTWISPYVKGPDDQPMKTAPTKVYEVSR